MVIWRIVDGRRGHDNQSRGLVNALSRHVSCVCHDISATNTRAGLWQLLLGKYPPGDSLPGPQLIIGAGHATHIHLLCARRAHGGRTVVIMKPSLPAALFDFCLIPDHDNPRITDRVIVTRGALNAIVPGGNHDPGRGLIMVGGPSRHFSWDDKKMLEQIKLVLKKSAGIVWSITDSSRTPVSTSNLLAMLKSPTTVFYSHKNTGPGWIEDRLPEAGQVWISEDSMSMIYESLTAGSPTGLLRVPVKQKGKITNCIQSLIENKMVTAFDEWKISGTLSPPADPVDEANRCAEYLLEMIK
jgi:mitochondrial fission protein ELM1